jgi:hypothetical protein
MYVFRHPIFPNFAHHYNVCMCSICMCAVCANARILCSLPFVCWVECELNLIWMWVECELNCERGFASRQTKSVLSSTSAAFCYSCGRGFSSYEYVNEQTTLLQIGRPSSSLLECTHTYIHTLTYPILPQVRKTARKSAATASTLRWWCCGSSRWTMYGRQPTLTLPIYPP